ncbi:MAG: glutamate--tRNA ligase [Patescibacteria group bacterium]
MAASTVRTRFAPSPTGYLHVGGLRTALYNYLFAKQHGGQFILRIEDTDQARLVAGATEKLLATLARVGLTPDEGPTQGGDYGPYVQSQRLPIYQQHVKQLVAAGQAYYCFCSTERLTSVRAQKIAAKEPPMYDRHCANLSADEVAKRLAASEPHTIRLRVPAGSTTLPDLVWGEVTIANATIDDQVLLKADGFPTYHLAVVVDDHLMNISHVLRGDEWLPSTPKHLLLYRAFGWPPPQFAHLPLILNPDRSKLSKRQGDVAAEDFLTQGYLPVALLNFIALLGWHPGGGEETEIFSLRELIKRFSIAEINKAGAGFDLQKLDWINGQYLRQLSGPELVAAARPFLAPTLTQREWPADYLEQVLNLERDRIKKLSDLPAAVSYFFEEPLTYDPQLLQWKDTPPGVVQSNLEKLAIWLASVRPWTAAGLAEKITAWIAEQGLTKGEVLWPLRVALSGRDKSPGPFEIAAVLGPDQTIERVHAAIEYLNGEGGR